MNIPFLQWPAIAFWASIVFGASGALSGAVIEMITAYGRIRFPSLTETAEGHQARVIVLAFMMLTTPFLAAVAYKTRVYMGKNCKKALQAQQKIISILNPINLVSCAVLPVSYVLSIYIQHHLHPVLSNISVILFMLSHLGFQLTTDMIYAVTTDTMIKIAWVTDIILTSIFGASVFFKLLTFLTSSKTIHSLFAILQLGFVIMGFFKLIFTGIVVIGARFIDSNFDIFKKQKQTIFDESFGMV